MTVGQVIAERTGLCLFHNHVSIELALRYFDFGTPGFRRINDAVRRRIVEEIAASDLPGLIFTCVRKFDVPEDEKSIDDLARPFRSRGGRVLCLELEAALAEQREPVAPCGEALEAGRPAVDAPAAQERRVLSAQFRRQVRRT